MLLTFGSGNVEPIENVDIKNLGILNSTCELNDAYVQSDLVILPSREDNLPNIMLEAWFNGRPVVSFKNGGMKDHIKDGVNGFLCENINGHDLATTINKALETNFNDDEIFTYAEANFSKKYVLPRFLNEVYELTMEGK